MNIYKIDTNVLRPLMILIIYDCMGATSWGSKRRKVPHMVQSATYKSLCMKHWFECFGSLSVVILILILILILIILYDIYVLDQYCVSVLSVHTIFWFWFWFCFWPGHRDYRWHYVTWANILFSVNVIYDLLS